MVIKITSDRLYRWQRNWPCSTLTTGYAVFDDRTGDLEDLGGKLARADVDGHELDAYIDEHQPAALRAVRGNRAH